MKSLSLGGLILAAIRTAVTDPNVVDKVDEVTQTTAELGERVAALTEALAANGSIDAEQQEELQSITAELSGVATVLGGAVVVDPAEGEPLLAETAAAETASDLADQVEEAEKAAEDAAE